MPNNTQENSRRILGQRGLYIHGYNAWEDRMRARLGLPALQRNPAIQVNEPQAINEQINEEAHQANFEEVPTITPQALEEFYRLVRDQMNVMDGAQSEARENLRVELLAYLHGLQADFQNFRIIQEEFVELSNTVNNLIRDFHPLELRIDEVADHLAGLHHQVDNGQQISNDRLNQLEQQINILTAQIAEINGTNNGLIEGNQQLNIQLGQMNHLIHELQANRDDQNIVIADLNNQVDAQNQLIEHLIEHLHAAIIHHGVPVINAPESQIFRRTLDDKNHHIYLKEENGNLYVCIHKHSAGRILSINEVRDFLTRHLPGNIVEQLSISRERVTESISQYGLFAEANQILELARPNAIAVR